MGLGAWCALGLYNLCSLDASFCPGGGKGDGRLARLASSVA